MKKTFFPFLMAIVCLCVSAQTFNNPVLPFDYSDPDVCAVGQDYYMTASSFNCSPGLPVLHSTDLVHWQLINYALDTVPNAYFVEGKVAHGNAVWAPSIRHHNGKYYIFWGDPDLGIFMVNADNPRNRWSNPELVIPGLGYIDPCPFWDNDGKMYVVYALAASRAMTNSALFLQRFDPSDMKPSGMPVLIYDGTYDDQSIVLTRSVNHTIEGPKVYKRDGYYYIFAPAGGVATGWQLALRSKDIFGPYESRVVMMQGTTNINGPHQGGWVETPSGESWFLHFQEKQPFGRVVHLNPVKWINGWPVIGNDKDGKGWGMPMEICQLPNARACESDMPMNDEFNSLKPGLQWQWQANYKPWFAAVTTQGYIRLYSHVLDDSEPNIFHTPNMLLQKIPSTGCVATAKVRAVAKDDNSRSGIIVMGLDYAAFVLQKRGNKMCLVLVTCENAENGGAERADVIYEYKPDRQYATGATTNTELELYLRVKIDNLGKCVFSYSTDGKRFRDVAKTFKAREGKWIGAKMGLVSVCKSKKSRSWMDCDWFHVE